MITNSRMQLHIYGNNSFDSMNILLHLMMSISPFKNNVESQIIFENDLLDINFKKKLKVSYLVYYLSF